MSKIDRVEIHEFQFIAENTGPDAGGFNFAYQPGAKLPITRYAVVICTDDGARGEYVMQFGGTLMALGQTRTLAPHLIGRDPFAREEIYNWLKYAIRQYDHMGYGAIDICLWDLAGKALSRPIAEILGFYRRKLPAYASTIHGDTHGSLSSPRDYADFAKHCLRLGYHGFKVHGYGTGDTVKEAETVRLLGREVGGKMALMTDPCCSLRTYADALIVGRACDEAGFFWYEDPFMDSGVSAHAHRRLRETIRTPLLITEHVRGLEAKADFIVSGGTDFLRVDPEYDFGITGTMKTAHLAESFGMDVEIHGAGPAHRHCMAAIRNTNFYEMLLVSPTNPNLIPPVYACGYDDQLESVDSHGCVTLPDGPGLGVEYDWQFINYHRVNLYVENV